MNKVCFTGHRYIKNNRNINKKLIDTIDECIKNGALDFYTGGAIGWDTICAIKVIELKKNNPNIRLHVILPCDKENQTKKWTSKQILDYDYIISNADSVEYISKDYYEYCMKIRNQRLVENADICICYYNTSKIRSGTGQTVRMAIKKNIKIINLFE